MATDFTPHYNLDKYTATDKPNLRDQYNAAMDKIDNALLSANTNATEAKSATLNFQEQLDAKATSAQLTAETTARSNADTALQTAIENEATARESADTALGTRITNETDARTSADTALGTRITNETTARSNADATLKGAAYYDDYDGNYAVWIGDSFTEAAYSGITKKFSTIVSEKYGLVEKNYAKGSTGFTHGSSSYPTMNFYGQLQAAIADNSFDNDDVKYVFVCGGRNDAGDTNAGDSVDPNVLATQITNILTTACSSFPNAYIVLIPLIYECVVPSSKQMRVYEYTMWDAHASIANHQLKNVIIVPKAYMWLQGRYGYVRNGDKIHPNQAGHNLIGSCIINALNGQAFSPSIDNPIPIVVSVDTTKNNFVKLIVDDSGVIWLHMVLDFTTPPSFGDYIARYEPTIEYDGAETLIVMRGNKFFNDVNGNRYQIECDNNFSLQSPNLSIRVQCLNAHSSTHVSCLTPVAFIGIDTSISGVL